MKKVAMAVLALLVLVAVFAVVGGFRAEQHFHAEVDKTQRMLPLYGMELLQANFRRGLLRSEADLVLGLPHADAEARVQLRLHSLIQHGPLLWTHEGLRLGFFTSRAEVTAQGLPAAVLRALDEGLAGQALQVDAYASLLDAVHLQMQVPAFRYALDGNTLTFDGMGVHVRGNRGFDRMQGTLTIGELLAVIAGNEIRLSAGEGAFRSEALSDWVNVGESSVRWPHAQIEMPLYSLQVHDITLQATQSLDQGRLNSEQRVVLGRMVSPLPVSSADYRLQIQGLDPAAIEHWVQLLADMQSRGESAQPDPERLRALLDVLLVPGLALNQHLHLVIMRGNFFADLALTYTGLPDGRHPMDIDQPQELLSAVRAELVVRGKEQVVMGTPLALFVLQPMQDGYLVREEGDLVLRALLENGRLTINGAPFPLQDWLAAQMPGAVEAE